MLPKILLKMYSKMVKIEHNINAAGIKSFIHADLIQSDCVSYEARDETQNNKL